MMSFHRSIFSVAALALCCSLFAGNNALAGVSFDCTQDSNCGHGICNVNSKCQCSQGFAHSAEMPCVEVVKKASYATPFWLELFVGPIFPAGLAYQDLWELAGIRLGIEAGAAGLWGVFAASRAYDRRTPPNAVVDEVIELESQTKGAVTAMPVNVVPVATPEFQYSRRTNEIKVLAAIATFYHAAAYTISTLFFGEAEYPDANIKKWLSLDKGTADLVVMGSKMAESARITLNTFDGDSCALKEKCVEGPGERRLLRFDSYIYNVGDADFVPAFETIKPEWSECHQHFHGPEATNYFLKQVLTSPTGDVVAMRYGHKQGYCFRDTLRISGSNTTPKFWCGIPTVTKQYTQGIQAGWADVYHSNLDCQWIDITNAPPGTYQLTVTVNPSGVYFQDNPDNNITVVEVVIPEVNTFLERTPNGRQIQAMVHKEYDE